jgi:uncharacterized membrane protein
MDLNAYAMEFVVVAIFVGIPLVVLRLLVRAANRPRDESSTILRRRFAKGEISETEFETAKRILGS